MRIPTIPTPPRIARLSFGQYQAGLHCLARLAVGAVKPRPIEIATPGAILGIAFHELMRRAHNADFESNSSFLERARVAFDEAALDQWTTSHPLLRVKFRETQRLPFYFQRREQAAVLAKTLATAVAPPSVRCNLVPRMPTGSERWLESGDGMLFGRADYLNASAQTVVDYKTGAKPQDAEVSAAEARQLRFYAHLAHENGVRVTRGQIIRADGSRDEITISQTDLDTEGAAARDVLGRYQRAVDDGLTFNALAAPSSEACKGCDAIPYCVRFWAEARASWSRECGTHVEGSVEDVRPVSLQGANLVSLRLATVRGTRGPDPVELEQLPTDWLFLDSQVKLLGATVRVIDARAVEARPGILRPDRSGTTVWQT